MGWFSLGVAMGGGVGTVLGVLGFVFLSAAVLRFTWQASRRVEIGVSELKLFYPNPGTVTDATVEEQSVFSHHGVICDGCSMDPLIGLRWKCKQCADYDLCNTCYTSFCGNGDIHDSSHTFENVEGRDEDAAASDDSAEQRLPVSGSLAFLLLILAIILAVLAIIQLFFS